MPSSSSSSNTRSTASWRPGGAFEFALELIEQRPGYLVCQATGRDAERAFAHEAGGHRWQRVPPNEKRGRVHTSTVTVAVFRQREAKRVQIRDADLDIRTTGSGGPGGQHANKTDSTVVMTHLPTGIRVRIESRSQHQNRITARLVLEMRLAERMAATQRSERNAKRRALVGSGMRGDKRRTVALQRGEVVDHITGKRTSAKLYLRGGLDALFPDAAKPPRDTSAR